MEEFARGDDNTWADGGDKKALGKAWIVSPLQFRSMPNADQAQEETEQHFNYAPLESEPSGAPTAPAAGLAPGSTDLQSLDRFGAQDVEGVRLQGQDAARHDTNAQDREAREQTFKTETIEQLGDQADTSRALALGAANEPPPGAPASRSVQGGAAPQQQQSASRNEPAQTERFSAKAAAQAPPQRPVRVVLFFNVRPGEQEPAGASTPQPVPLQPSGASDGCD